MSFELPCEIHGYTFLKHIGKGGFAHVYKVYNRKFDRKFAAKVLFLEREQTVAQRAGFEAEMRALTDLQHHNIIKIYDHFEYDCHFVLVLEYCKGGTITTDVQKNGPYRGENFVIMARQLLSALAYCHENNISHRDLKPTNILLNKNGIPKIADFGLSIKFYKGELHEQHAASLVFTAPEHHMSRPFEPTKADIWSLGIVFFYMLAGDIPFKASNVEELKHLIKFGAFRMPRGLTPEAMELLKKMIVTKPEMRLTAAELLELPLFQKSHQLPMELDLDVISSSNSVDDALSPRRREALLSANPIKANEGESLALYLYSTSTVVNTISPPPMKYRNVS